MKEYKTSIVEVEEQIFDSITCDVCKKKYTENEDDFEIQEFQCIHFRGGYGSIFGDGVEMECDICQHCLNTKLGDFLVSKDERF